MSECSQYQDQHALVSGDIVGSTQRAVELGDSQWSDLLREHHSLVRRELARFRGRELDTAGDGFFASFDGPARAIRYACAVRDAVRTLGLELRSGLHTGECELVGDKPAGIAIKDLVAGSGIEFEERGTHELKGLDGEWQLYAVSSAE
jgi:class 3 adenylate cyclase